MPIVLSLLEAHPQVQQLRQQQGGGLSPQSLFGVNTPFGSLNILGANRRPAPSRRRAFSATSAASSATSPRPSRSRPRRASRSSSRP